MLWSAESSQVEPLSKSCKNPFAILSHKKCVHPSEVPEGEEATHPSTAKMWRVLQEKADIKDDAEVMLGGFEHASSRSHSQWTS